MRVDARLLEHADIRFRTRVWLDGEEVTGRCFLVDTDTGIVGLYRLNAEGRKFNENGRIATEERRGEIRVEQSV